MTRPRYVYLAANPHDDLVCQLCGAVVGDKDRHDTWHTQSRGVETEIAAAIASPAFSSDNG